MPTQRIATRLQNWDSVPDQKNMVALMNAVQDDLTALRASIVLITAKLDADAGVTDTNYAATTNPAALTVLK